MRAGLVVALVAATSAIAQTPEAQRILASRCSGCHGAAQQMSGLRLDNRDSALAGGYSGPVIVPGNSAESKLIKRVSGAPGMMVMPPSGPRLTPEQITVLRSWIDTGAQWTAATGAAQSSSAKASAAKSPHWAFQPVQDPALPSVKDRNWARNLIDAYVLAHLENEGLVPSPEADKRILVRRVSLDL